MFGLRLNEDIFQGGAIQNENIKNIYFQNFILEINNE